MSVITINRVDLDPRDHLHWQFGAAERRCIGPFSLQCKHSERTRNAQWEICVANGHWLVRGHEVYIKHVFEQIELQYAAMLMTRET